jgi:hypothetical protein
MHAATMKIQRSTLALKQANPVSIFGRSAAIFSGRIFSVQLASRAVI